MQKRHHLLVWIASLLLVCLLVPLVAACGGPGNMPDTESESEMMTETESEREAESVTGQESQKVETETKKMDTQTETETKKLTELEKVTAGITTEPELTQTVQVIDGTLYMPLNVHDGAYYSQKNPAGTPIAIEPLISDGMYGKCFVYEDMPLRNGWFFRCGSNSGAFRVSLTKESEITFWVYVSDKSSLIQAEFELGSNQHIDQMEKEWGFLNQLKNNGWNKITLDLKTTGNLDLSSVSRWRLFYLSNATSGSVTLAVDDIRITHAVDLTDQDDLKPAVQTAKLVVNPFDSKIIHVADLDVTQAPYSADTTGAADCSSVLTRALTDCSESGGGTVYLPSGTYLISKPVTIPANVTLAGDFRPMGDGAADGNFGTVLCLKGSQTTVKLSTASGVDGLTVNYPEQLINSVIGYAPTFTAASGSTVRNVNLVNSYDAYTIETGHGMLTVDGLRGTVLHQGLLIGYAAEIDVFENIDLGPAYWHLYDSSVTENAVRNVMSSKSTYGMRLWGDEGTMVANMRLDGFNTGIYTEKTRRSDGAEVYGQFINIEIKNAKKGVVIDAAYTQMGDEFAYSTIEGSEAAFVNNTSQVVKFFKCTLKGSIQCPESYYTQTDKGVTVPQFSRSPELIAPLKLFNVHTDYEAVRTGKADASEAIQKALDDAHRQGGGYVYIPGGEYLIQKSLKVYDDTILIGANASGSFDCGGNGTTLLADWGLNGNTESEQGLITITGSDSGLAYMRVVYIKNGLRAVDDDTFDSYAPIALICGDRVTVSFVQGYNTAHGIVVSGSQNVFLYRICGGFYATGITIKNSKNVRADAVLANLAGQASTSYASFQTYPTVDSATMQEMGRKHLTLFVVEDSEDIEIVNSFAYKPQMFIKTSRSAVSCFNIYSSRMGTENTMINQLGGSFNAVNVFLKFTMIITAKKALPAQDLEYHIFNIKGQGLPVSDNDRDYKVP